MKKFRKMFCLASTLFLIFSFISIAECDSNNSINVPYSTIQRMSKISLNILAGQEICVAATKSFTNQVSLMLSIAKEFGFNINLDNLSEKIQEVMGLEEDIKKIANKIYQKNDLYVLGRGLSYPVAREIALKIKEISYIHAEGMMGGELKHGTLALIESGSYTQAAVEMLDSSWANQTPERAHRLSVQMSTGTWQ